MKRRVVVLVVLMAIALAGLSSPALAHGHIEVGNYEIVIGFHNEPAIQGQPNSLDLFVTQAAGGQPVNGLEESLSAELIFGGSTKSMAIEPAPERDGAYTTESLILTRAGDYTWRIFGMLDENTPVDVSLTSSPDTFGSVQPAADFQFPAVAEDEGVSAGNALAVGIAGLVAGLLGLAVGLWALVSARRRTG
jgi:hypothetical protein